jgi:arylsulfatase A-like enzyme
MVDHFDEAVGRLLAKLDELGVAGNTIVIFMSDNGGRVPQTSNAPLRGSKGELLEGGIREPMIVRWPGVVKPNSVSNTPVTSTDFYPTLLEAASLPLRPEQHADGVSFLPLLQGESTAEERTLFWHYPHYNSQPLGIPSGAVRQGDWKLIEFYHDQHVELYNLRDDIGEANDLAAVQPGRAAAMREQLHQWRSGLDARMPTPNPKYIPGAPSGWPEGLQKRYPHTKQPTR